MLSRQQYIVAERCISRSIGKEISYIDTSRATQVLSMTRGGAFFYRVCDDCDSCAEHARTSCTTPPACGTILRRICCTIRLLASSSVNSIIDDCGDYRSTPSSFGFLSPQQVTYLHHHCRYQPRPDLTDRHRRQLPRSLTGVLHSGNLKLSSHILCLQASFQGFFIECSAFLPCCA